MNNSHSYCFTQLTRSLFCQIYCIGYDRRKNNNHFEIFHNNNSHCRHHGDLRKKLSSTTIQLNLDLTLLRIITITFLMNGLI